MNLEKLLDNDKGGGTPENLSREDINERQAAIDQFNLDAERDSQLKFSNEIMEARICRELNIDEDILAIYPYGSTIYGTADENSDRDFVIVTKGALLKSGGFKQNAISSKDRSIQGILYSRSGFIDAINNYEITALECLSIPENIVIKSKWPFGCSKWEPKEMIKKIISKASNSWHTADLQAKDGWGYPAKKGIFHALRILHFGLQLKEHRKIVDFEECNWIWEDFKLIDNDEFDTRDYIKQRDELIEKLRS